MSSFFVTNFGIDLGTANTLVYIPGKGIVYREATAIAIDEETGKVIAIGNKAKEMIDKTPSNIKAIRPLKEGVIADFTATKLMLRELLSLIFSRFKTLKPSVIVGIPLLITEVEKRAVKESLIAAGMREVELVEESIASAVGSGIDISEAKGKMIVDIGGGTTEIAVLSLGGIVNTQSIKIAGDKFDEDIIKFVKRKYGVELGAKTAERLKKEIACATPLLTTISMTVKGKAIYTGLPVDVEVTSEDMEKALRESLKKVGEEIKSTIENTSPELVSDIMDTGIMLTGGGALIKNIDEYVYNATRIQTFIGENPLDSVAVGTGLMLNPKSSRKGMKINE